MSYAASAVDYITVAAPGGFEWETQPNPSGYSLAEFFYTAPNQFSGDLLVNPQVDAVAATAGTGSLFH